MLINLESAINSPESFLNSDTRGWKRSINPWRRKVLVGRSTRHFFFAKTFFLFDENLGHIYLPENL